MSATNDPALIQHTPDFSAPATFQTRQRAAWERFQTLPTPVRTHEEWRFSDIKALALDGFTRAEAVSDAEQAAILATSAGLDAVAGQMIFANDRLLSRKKQDATLKNSGVIFLPLERAIAEHADLIERHFMREDAILGSQKFAALHAANLRTGTFLYVPRGVEISLPLEAWHWHSGEGASVFPHTLIIAEDNARVTFVDRLASTTDAAGFACSVNDLIVGQGAQVTYVCVQDWSRAMLSVQINSTVVARDARARSLNINLGSRYARHESVSHLRGQGANSEMLAVTVAEGAQQFDQRTFQIHEQPNTTSDLLYKNSLDDRSRSVFSGLIRVSPGAHKTDAYQKVRNLLLSDEAEANSMPGLEIEADDVRCTHGATSGQIELEELFYLQSRGIPLKDAQKLIVHGFLEEVIERLGNPALVAHLAATVNAKFDAHAR